MTVEDKPDVTYEDVGGCKDALEKLREVVELPLLHPERFVTLGIDPPKGVLLFGPPGTGKTLSARAVANRTDACFIRVIGSELVQKYVGEGARMVRELFTMARSKKACIVFFDEIDAIGETGGLRFCFLLRVFICSRVSFLRTDGLSVLWLFSGRKGAGGGGGCDDTRRFSFFERRRVSRTCEREGVSERGGERGLHVGHTAVAASVLLAYFLLLLVLDAEHRAPLG